VTLEAGYEAEEAALRATRHTRWESVYGGAVDVAVGVRGNACILLAAMGSTQALRAASELLAGILFSLIFAPEEEGGGRSPLPADRTERALLAIRLFLRGYWSLASGEDGASPA